MTDKVDVFQKMWKELIQRLAYANIYSVNKNLTYQDMINLMAAYEEEFKTEIQMLEQIELEKEKDNEKAAKNKKG